MTTIFPTSRVSRAPGGSVATSRASWDAASFPYENVGLGLATESAGPTSGSGARAAPAWYNSLKRVSWTSLKEQGLKGLAIARGTPGWPEVKSHDRPLIKAGLHRILLRTTQTKRQPRKAAGVGVDQHVAPDPAKLGRRSTSGLVRTERFVYCGIRPGHTESAQRRRGPDDSAQHRRPVRSKIPIVVTARPGTNVLHACPPANARTPSGDPRSAVGFDAKRRSDAGRSRGHSGSTSSVEYGSIPCRADACAQPIRTVVPLLVLYRHGAAINDSPVAHTCARSADLVCAHYARKRNR